MAKRTNIPLPKKNSQAAKFGSGIKKNEIKSKRTDIPLPKKESQAAKFGESGQGKKKAESNTKKLPQKKGSNGNKITQNNSVKSRKLPETVKKTQKGSVKGTIKKNVDWIIRDIKSDFLPTEKRQKVQNQIAKEKAAEYKKKGGFANDKIGQFYTGVGEGIVNNSLPGAVYGIVKGKKLSDSKTMTKGNKTIKKPTKDAESARKAGNIAGEVLGYAIGYGATGKGTGKLAEKALATKAGKKATEKALASKAGKKVGEETAKKVVKSATKNLTADATIGTALDLGLARGEGKKGKELAKDMAKNAAINVATGGVMEALPLAGKGLSKLKGKLKDTHLETRIVDGKVKNVRVEGKADTAKKVAESGNLKVKAGTPRKTKLPTKSEKAALETVANVESAGKVRRTTSKKAAKVNEFHKDLDKEFTRAYGEAHDKLADYIREYKGKGSTTNVIPIMEDNTGRAYRSTVSNNDPWYSKALKKYGSNSAVNKNADEIADEILKGDLRSARGQQEFADEYLYELGRLKKRNSIPMPERRPKTSEIKVKLKDLGADIARPNQTVKEAAEKYGTYDGIIPKSTDYGKVTQGAKTVYNSPIADKKTQEAIKANIEEGSYWTRKTTNKEKLDLAADKIKTNGLDFETKSFENILKEGKEVRSDDIAMGYQLAREHINKGNYEAAQTVLSDVCQMESEAGRTLQAMRLFNSLSPEGRVKNVIRSVDNIKKNTGVNVNISDEMLNRLRNASEEELPALRKQINIELWNQVPATFSEKLTAWRYLAMLGNPRTHIRNIVGNALYVPVVRMDNIVQSGLQKAFSRKLEKVGAKKTAAILTNSSDDRALKKFAGEQFDKLRKTLDSGNGKYNEELRPLEAKVFNNRFLEGAKKLNSAALEAEDQLFMKINFDSAFAQYCKANGKKVGDLTEEFIQQASEHAYNEALRSTYRDPSKLADALARFRKNLNVKATDDATMKVAKTAGKVVMDSALPFTKTPINILRRGVSHSPLGLAKGMYQIVRAKDAIALQKAITQVAEGLTGTGVVALGMYMGNKGLANGSLGEYNSEYKWKQLLGKQDYALNIGDYSITMDWAAPICMPFFVGVELGNSILKEGGNLWDGIESLSQIYQPVLEMSMLSGVQNLFDFANGDSKDIVKFMGNAAQNLASQFIPTLVGQTARTLVPERKIALSTAENKLQRDTEKYIDKLENKIPGLTNTNQSFVDMFGRTDSKQSPTDYLKAGLENFLSPAYVQKKETDRTALELENLRQELGSEGKDVIPTDYSSRYTVRYDGRDIRMNPEQFTEYKKIRGQEVYKGLSSLTSSSEYQNMTTDEKKEAVRDVYEAAADAAKRSIVISMGETTTNAYDYGELNKTQKALVDSGTMSVSQVKEANQILSESGADSSAGKAYALAESGMNEAAVVAMTSKTALEKATKLREAGATKEDVINAARTIRESGYTKNVGKAYALLDSGQSQSVVDVLVSENAVARATAIKRAEITPEMLDNIAEQIDSNGNGHYSNDELISYLSNINVSRIQKWAVFEALKSSSRTSNPF